ncbi:MAG: universal stress protein [Gammaproteobacteria bacterium]|nr:universal stress protein [Gammaproteobacteria bacterium]
MSIKKILVPLDGSNASYDVLDTALVVAKRFGAHIDALHVMQRPEDAAPFMFDRIPGKLRETVAREVEKYEREEAAAVRQKFENFCERNNLEIRDSPAAQSGVTATWHEEFGRTSEVLVRCGRLADVIATARPKMRKGAVRRSPIGENVEAVMLGSGRPVLIVPPKWKAKRVEHAAIGWNESVEASRALAMTMPWLEQMSTVTVIVSKKRKDGAERLSNYLALHGVHAQVQYLDGKGNSVGDSILRICSEGGVEFLVVGGFSHARARQLLFGGVTQHLLRFCDIITVMVH